MTLTTHASPRKTPCQMKPVSHHGDAGGVEQRRGAILEPEQSAARSSRTGRSRRRSSARTPPPGSRASAAGRRPATSRCDRCADPSRAARRPRWCTTRRANALRLGVDRADRFVAEVAGQTATQLLGPPDDRFGIGRLRGSARVRRRPAAECVGCRSSLRPLQRNLPAEPIVGPLLTRDERRQLAGAQRLFDAAVAIEQPDRNPRARSARPARPPR